MKNISITVLVDVENIIRGGSLGHNITLTDNGPASIGRGTSELVTGCYQDSELTWVVVPKHGRGHVLIKSFHSNPTNFFPAIPDIISPEPMPISEPPVPSRVFSGVIDKKAVTGRLYQYTMILLIDGKEMSWDPFITILRQEPNAK